MKRESSDYLHRRFCFQARYLSQTRCAQRRTFFLMSWKINTLDFHRLQTRRIFIKNVIFCSSSKIKVLSSISSSSQPSFEYKRNKTTSSKQIHPVKYETHQKTRKPIHFFLPASAFSFWESERSTTFFCAVESLTLKWRVRKKEVRIWIEMISITQLLSFSERQASRTVQ